MNYIAVSIQYPSSPPDLTLKPTSVLLTKSEVDNVIELTNICELELVSWISTQEAKTNVNSVSQWLSPW